MNTRLMNARLWTGYRPRIAVFAAAIFVCACRAGSSAAAQASLRLQNAPIEETAPPANAQPPKVGDIAPDFGLNDLKDEAVRLSILAEKGPVVLVVLRGFPGYQCPICTVQVGQLIGKAEPLKQANARVLLVYPGPSEGLKARADEFVRGKDLPDNFYLVLDPDFQFTNQYGLRWKAAGETSYPSTFVLDSERKVLFAKVSRSHGDRAKVDEVLAALPR